MKENLDPDEISPESLELSKGVLSREVERRTFLGRTGRLFGGLVAARYMFMLDSIEMAKPAQEVAKAGLATFDMISLFPEQYLAPDCNKTSTFFNVEIRNIDDVDTDVSLSVSSESDQFRATINPLQVTPGGKDGVAKARVDVSCLSGTEEGSVGWFEVNGKRGSESHRLWLQVNAISSLPTIKLPRGINLADLEGKGYGDPVLKPYVGEPLTWEVNVSNEGGEEDTYKLSYEADFQCDVIFRDNKDKKIRSIKLPGRTRNLLYPKPFKVVAEVVPREELPKNEPRDVKLILGPGKHTRETSELILQAMNPGMLYCVNDLAGSKPNAHQVMAGQTTTFMFHVSNLDDEIADIELSVEGEDHGWQMTLVPEKIEKIKKGRTEQAILSLFPPSTAAVGEKLELTVSAKSSTGREDEVRIAAEITDKPKIYFWSVDSMDPTYLDLNRRGTGTGKDGDWLMPNVRDFMKKATNYRNALVYLPSATDMNHTNALAGTYSGTAGVYMVGGTYEAFGPHDEVITAPNTMALMRYGPDGKEVERVYEVAKRYTGGKAVCGFWSNKNWLTELEAGRTLDVYGHSERWPLFFHPPSKYRAAGDPQTDQNPKDRYSDTFKSCMHSNNWKSVVLPTLLGQFDISAGMHLLGMPISLAFGDMPGMHAEDRYLYSEFERTIIEEDPDVSYINVADLDNTGHFTGASSEYTFDEWEKKGDTVADDENKYSPWMRRDECLDICREVDLLFADFLTLLKNRGVYDSSIIVFLSDHGMNNMKDPKKGYELVNLRTILRENGFVRREDYEESGGTELNFIWFKDPEKGEEMERVLREYTVDDKELGEVRPIIVVNREQMKEGMDWGDEGTIRPMELYSEYWVNHDYEENGHMWPDLFVFPRYNYQVAAHGDVFGAGINAVGVNFGMKVPETVVLGFPAAHGGLGTTPIPLIIKAPEGYPEYRPGTEHEGEVEVGDIAPTIYEMLGWEPPDCVDGESLPSPPA